jgi:outer membrane receptor protein involved in Fe transport
VCALTAFAQSPNAAITGTISDAGGARVPSVEVLVRHVDTGLTFTAKSSEDGTYTLPSIPIGTVDLSATAQGFKTFQRKGILLEVNQRARVDITLELGAVNETITVTAEVPRIDTETAALGAIVEQERIEQLPLNGRHVFSLVQLVAGVQPANPDNDGFAEITNQGFSQMRVNGGPTYGNQIMLDGGTNTVPVHGEISVVPQADSVKEFKVETNGLKAEYGQSSGGVINVVTKSGGNRVTGSAYEFVRNDYFDARNAFAVDKDPVTGRYNPMLRYNQYGGTLGGPVVIPKLYSGRNRTFFYVGYEQWRYKSGSLARGTVPTERERSGDFSQTRNSLGQLLGIFDPSTTRANPNGSGSVRDPFPGNVIPSSRFDKVAVNVLKYMPQANVPGINQYTNSNNFLSLAAAPVLQSTTQIKIDHRFTPSDSMFARYSRNRNHRGGGGYGLGPADPDLFARDDQRDNHNFVLSETHIVTPNILNEFRGNITRQHLDFLHGSVGGNWPEKLGFPSMIPQDLFPRINVESFLNLGATNPTYGNRSQHNIQFTDSLTILRGRHQIKIGTDQRWVRLNYNTRNYPSGLYSFSSSLTSNPQQSAGTGFGLATFLLGEVSGGQLDIRPAYSFHAWMNGSYVQDDWKVTPRFTVNLGLRYDFSSEPVERHNRFSNFDPYVINPQTGMRGSLVYAGAERSRQFVNRDYNNLGPRVGLAYALTGDGKTAVRSAFGILYMNDLSGNTSGDNANSLGFSSSTPWAAPVSNQRAFKLSEGPANIIKPLGPEGGATAFRGLNVRYQDSNARVPYQVQWNFTIDRALPGRWTASVGYAGNHGVKLFGGNYEINQINPEYFSSLGLALQNTVPNPYAGKIPGSSLNNASVSRLQTLRPMPDYLNVTTFANHGNSSIYHSLLVTVQRRYSNGLSVMVSYTNSKLIDETTSSGGSQSGADNYRIGAYNRRLDRGIDTGDVSQRMVISNVYELPFFKKNKGWDRRILGGWQLNSITTLQTGDPVEVSGANNFTSINWPDLLSNPTLKGSDRNPYRWFNTDSFRNPADWTIGNTSRSLPDTRNPGMFTMNLSLFKVFKTSEKVRTEIRGEAFNAVNHVNLGSPNASFSPNRQGVSTNALFGRITAARPARRLQFGVRLSW